MFRFGVLVSAVLLTAQAQAAVISLSANVIDEGRPASVDLRQGATEDDANFRVYQEVEDLFVSAPTTVNFLVGDNVNVGDQLSGPSLRVVAASPPLLPAGRYNSYYIHYDRTVGGTIADQFIQFSDDIVALIVTSIGSPNVLEETDSLFGLAAYTYPVLGGRGLEDGNDVLTLSAADTLQIDSLAVGADFVDGIRVITGVVVPLPASILGLLAGLGLLWVKRRRPS